MSDPPFVHDPPVEALAGAEAALDYGRRAAVREAGQHGRRGQPGGDSSGPAPAEDEAAAEHSGIASESHRVSFSQG